MSTTFMPRRSPLHRFLSFPRPAFVGLAVSALLAGGSALGAQAAPAAEAPRSLTPQQQTVTEVRTVGVAMFYWFRDVQAPRRTTHPWDGQSKTVDLSQIPKISRDELARLLVPKYIAEVPEKDAWGHPYEFRLNTKDPNAERVMAVRSAGADGTFSGTTYKVGSFPAAQTDQDLVWTDGYYIRWPAR